VAAGVAGTAAIFVGSANTPAEGFALGAARTGGASDRAVRPLPIVAADVGSSWAKDLRDALAREGRTVVDGWPGTISEARVRTCAALACMPSGRRIGAVELAELVRCTYHHARASWLGWRTA
jgi:hypothetical protein